jgi:hypothetical protein
VLQCSSNMILLCTISSNNSKTAPSSSHLSSPWPKIAASISKCSNNSKLWDQVKSTQIQPNRHPKVTELHIHKILPSRPSQKCLPCRVSNSKWLNPSIPRAAWPLNNNKWWWSSWSKPTLLGVLDRAALAVCQELLSSSLGPKTNLVRASWVLPSS